MDWVVYFYTALFYKAMEEIQVQQLIESLDEQGIASREANAIAHLKDVYYQIFRETVTDGCGDCIRKAWGKIRLLTFKTITDMANSKFKLKDDVLLPIGDFGTSEFLSKDNLTDALAYQVLNKFPSLLSQFAEYPKDEEGNLLKEGDKAPEVDEQPASEFVPLDGGTPSQEEVEKALAVLSAAGQSYTPLASLETAPVVIDNPVTEEVKEETEAPAENVDAPVVEPVEVDEKAEYLEYLKGKTKEELRAIYLEEVKEEAPVRWAKDLLIEGIIKAQD